MERQRRPPNNQEETQEAELDGVNPEPQMPVAYGGRNIARPKAQSTRKIEPEEASANQLAVILANQDAQRRLYGMVVGTMMFLMCTGASLYISIAVGVTVMSLGFLLVGAACAGATFAVITGQPVRAEDFSNLLKASGEAMSGTQSKGE